MKIDKLRVYPLSEIGHLKIHGRTTGSMTPVTVFWTSSGIELNVSGSELWVEVETRYKQYEPWLCILINGVPVSRQMLTVGRQWICIFRGMSGDTVKHVRIVKETQAMGGDPGSSVQLHAVKSDGSFHAIEAKPYKLEFVGDSITSGEGAIGAKAENDWIPMWFSAVHNYTAITAEMLDAEYRVISQSGWGVLTSWDNNPNGNIPQYYEQVCGILDGGQDEVYGAHQANDFAAWQPDVVIVNLGTNDGGAFQSPAWTDEATGQVFKQRLNADGTCNEEDLQAFEQAAQRFLEKLRSCNPKAHIVWAYGMLGTPMLPAIYRAVDAYVKQSRDRRVTVFQLPGMTEHTIGARAHPGIRAHERAAQDLAAYIKTQLSSQA